MKVSSRSYQLRMALNTWHVWQYVIGIDITLSLAESTRHFFTVAAPKTTVDGVLIAHNHLLPSWPQVLCHLTDAGLTVANTHESEMKPR